MKKDELTVNNARSESEIFAALSKLCRSPGYVHAIAHFCARDNFIMYAGDRVTEADTQHQYSHDKLLRTEISTLIGLMAKAEIDATLPLPQTLQFYIYQSEYLLHEMHLCLQKPWMAAFQQMTPTAEPKIVDPFNTAESLREPIFYSGESAYNFQYAELAGLKYRADNDWLVSNVGFSIDEAILFARGLGELQMQKFLGLRGTMRKVSPDQWTFLGAFSFHCEELVAKIGMDLEKIRRIIDAFSVPSQSTNDSFSSLSAFNQTNSTPIIALDDGIFLLLQNYSLLEALYETPFFWMAADKSYCQKASYNRGLFVETFLTNRLRCIFGTKRVFQNVDIYKGKDRFAEIDVLVLYGSFAIVIQAKSKRLTIEARKGNDLQLKSDFKKAIHDAYDQAHRCSSAILDKDYKFVLSTGDELIIPEKISSIFPVCIVADHFPALAFQARQFLKVEKQETIQRPIITDVFFVDVLTEMLETPLQFLNYLVLRAKFDEKLFNSQELVNLGYHPNHNLWFEDQNTFVTLGEDFTSSLDIAMTARRASTPGERTPKGILTRFAGSPIGELINQIEAAATPELVGLGMIFLQMGPETVKHINIGLIQLVRLAGKDGNHHDFSIPTGSTNSGFTVHINALSDGIARERLSVHCQLKKYQTKADNWYGLLIEPNTGLIRSALVLDETWKYNKDLERSLQSWPQKPMVPLNVISKPIKKQKTGRNDICPCGSGKKYKKCCLS